MELQRLVSLYDYGLSLGHIYILTLIVFLLYLGIQGFDLPRIICTIEIQKCTR